MLSIGVETDVEALNGERKPLLALQESVPEQASSFCLEFPGMPIVPQSHHRGWGRGQEGESRGLGGEDIGRGRPRLPWRASR